MNRLNRIIEIIELSQKTLSEEKRIRSIAEKYKLSILRKYKRDPEKIRETILFIRCERKRLQNALKNLEKQAKIFRKILENNVDMGLDELSLSYLTLIELIRALVTKYHVEEVKLRTAYREIATNSELALAKAGKFFELE